MEVVALTSYDGEISPNYFPESDAMTGQFSKSYGTLINQKYIFIKVLIT